MATMLRRINNVPATTPSLLNNLSFITPIVPFTTNNFFNSSSSSSSVASTTPSTVYRIPSRSYLAQPRPSLTIQEIHNLAKPRSRTNDTQRIKIGAPLTVSELPAYHTAKTMGYLQFGSGCTATVCNTYYRLCWSLQRPYIALNPHGTLIIFDVRSIQGLRNLSVPENQTIATTLQQSIKTYLQGITTILSQNPGNLPVQISSDQSIKDQVNRTLSGANEGTNYFKDPITSFVSLPNYNTVFTLHTQGKAHARAVAEALYSAYTSIFNIPTPQQILLQKQQRKNDKLHKFRTLRIRQLRKLVSNEDNLRHLYTPKGVVDGFIRADRTGQIKLK